MRTNIEIDDELLAAARSVAGTTTKRQTVEVALRELVDRNRRAEILRLRGHVRWEGDLQASRADRGMAADADRRPDHRTAAPDPDGRVATPRHPRRPESQTPAPAGVALGEGRQRR